MRRKRGIAGVDEGERTDPETQNAAPALSVAVAAATLDSPFSLLSLLKPRSSARVPQIKADSFIRVESRGCPNNTSPLFFFFPFLYIFLCSLFSDR